MSVLDEIEKNLLKEYTSHQEETKNYEESPCHSSCSLTNLVCELNLDKENIKTDIELLSKMGFSNVLKKYNYKIIPIIKVNCESCPYKMGFKFNGVNGNYFCTKPEYYEAFVEKKQEDTQK